MPDNVARIIAGASAAFTASSMAISYATYRRARPRLKVADDFSLVMQDVPDGVEISCYMEILVRNSGQSAVKLTEVIVELRESLPKRFLKHALSQTAAPVHTWHPQLPQGADTDATAFGGVRWRMKLCRSDLEILEAGGAQLRVGVGLLSGAVVYGRWHRKPSCLPSSRSTIGTGRPTAA
ncbi:hypothetical protein [Streptomyces sp. NPDC046759]|uniref:hypothetical protein n=1 Tax=Streptomyces sp. NPDC046759 TaxID=3155019 RepID=UPI0033DD324D